MEDRYRVASGLPTLSVSSECLYIGGLYVAKLSESLQPDPTLAKKSQVKCSGEEATVCAEGGRADSRAS